MSFGKYEVIFEINRCQFQRRLLLGQFHLGRSIMNPIWRSCKSPPIMKKCICIKRWNARRIRTDLIEMQPIFPTLYWDTASILYSILRDSLYSLLYIERQLLFPTLYWETASISYSLLRYNIYSLLFIEIQPIFPTLYWDTASIIYSILWDSLYSLLYTERQLLFPTLY